MSRRFARLPSVPGRREAEVSVLGIGMSATARQPASRLTVPPWRRRLPVHGLTAAWSGVVSLALFMPVDPDLGDRVSWLPLPIDKVAHAVLFFGCTLFVHRSLRLERWRRSLLWGAAATFSYGLATEVVQHLLPTRGFELEDGVANGVGVGVYVAAAWALDRFRRPLAGGPV